MIKVAINGFGRIGRMVFRAGHKHPDIQFVAVNDLTDTKTLAHLLRYDSVHGRFDGEISFNDSSITVNGTRINVYAERDPANLPWAQLDIDVVVESTGFFRTEEKAGLHLKAGAKKVVLSAPGKGNIFTIVKGVNEHLYDGQAIVSNASCTTNCLAPLVKVLNDNYGIRRGFMTTVHAFTADQRLVDAPHRDLRRARHATQSIVPTSTGAAVAVGEVLPKLKGKLDGIAMRVPVPDGSVVDFVCQLKEDTTVASVNELFKNVSNHELKGIVQYTEDPIVGVDIIGNPHSSIFDSSLTKMMDGNFLKIVSWYDNEYGYSCRMIDIILLVARK